MRFHQIPARYLIGAFGLSLMINVPRASADLTGFGNGAGYQLNYRFGFDNTGPSITNGVLALTDGQNLEARSAFATTRQDVRNFQVHFQYQATPYSGSLLGDGMTFTIQNDPRGAAAVGNSGSGLGYEGITSSVAIELNLFGTFNGTGTFLGINGTTGASQGGYLPTGAVSLIIGDPIGVDLIYNGSVLTERLTDLQTGSAFQMSYTVDIASIVGGSTAYMGFTGGTGLALANQTISNFTEVTPEPPSLILAAIGILGVGGVRTARRTWAARSPAFSRLHEE